MQGLLPRCTRVCISNTLTHGCTYWQFLLVRVSSYVYPGARLPSCALPHGQPNGKPLPTALVDKICSLPDETQVYVGHEYTVCI